MNSKLKALESVANAINLSDDVQKHVLFAAAKSVAEEIRRELDEKDATTENDAFGTAQPREKLASAMSTLSRAVMPDDDTDAESALNNTKQNLASLRRDLGSSAN